MQPIGLLMREHRLIERIIPLLKSEQERSKKTKKINSIFINTAIDFFQTYADKIHHGKEEDILFKALLPKKLNTEQKTIMKQLLEDHQRSRQVIHSLKDANQKYLQGEISILPAIQDSLGQLIALYPHHIEIEDKHFFFPIMEYFSRKECDDMLQKFTDFDRNIIHEHYTLFIEEQEKKGS